MHFSLKQMFLKQSGSTSNQLCWRRFLKILMLHRREKCKKKLSSNAEYNIVRFRLSQQAPICFDCQSVMDSHIALYQHCRKQHPKSLVNALCCDAEFYTLAALTAHCKSAHTGQHICIRCCTFFESAVALESHLSEHGPKNELFAYFCIVCGTFRNSIIGIESHLRSEHDVNNGEESHYVCQVPQLALEMTLISDKTGDHEICSKVLSRSYTPTLKDCMSYVLNGTLQAA